MSQAKTLTAALMLTAVLTSATQAATIRVARDGTGDYSIVPEAVRAAAAGDTILIAAGVYPEVQIAETPGGPIAFVGRVEVDDLTVIGAGPDDVILGPEVPAADLEIGPGGFQTSVDGNVRVRGVTVRNLRAGVWGNGAWVEVEDCRFVGNFYGVAMTTSGAGSVRDCEFESSESRGVIVFNSRGGSGSSVEDSRFIDNTFGVDFQPSGCSVRGSTFSGGFVGVQVSFGGSADVRDCTFSGMISVGVNVSNSAGYLYDNRFEDDMAVNIKVGGLLVGSGNELLGGSSTTLRITGLQSTLDFHGNHILNGGGWSVSARFSAGPPLIIHDFSGNYWGTIDTDQIDAWIEDRFDNPAVNYVVIDYLPLAEGPISSETSSFGGLKARFNGEQ